MGCARRGDLGVAARRGRRAGHRCERKRLDDARHPGGGRLLVLDDRPVVQLASAARQSMRGDEQVSSIEGQVPREGIELAFAGARRVGL